MSDDIQKLNFLPSSAALLDSMGSDKTVVDAARVSFAKFGELGFGKGDPTMGDADLIRYLATGMRTKTRKLLMERITECESVEDADRIIEEIGAIAQHWTPFGHCMATFHIRAPIFVHRQITRSGVGLVINEESRRYVSDTPTFYKPRVWRTAPVDAKQGSGGPASPFAQNLLTMLVHTNTCECLDVYETMLRNGCAPEQARMVLPLNTHTQWVWTGSLYAWARICKLRLAGDAQEETRDVAIDIAMALSTAFPLSWRALVPYRSEHKGD